MLMSSVFPYLCLLFVEFIGYRLLEIEENGEKVSYCLPDRAVVAEITVYVSVSEPFVAHKIEVI